MSEEKPTLKEKLLAIMADCDRIEKDAVNAHQRYKYASENAIKSAIHPLLVKHRVLFHMEAGTPERDGGVLVLPVVAIFEDVDSDAEIRFPFLGSGHTRDDKGIYAAVTGAIKYILTTTFLIPTGDDPEAQDEKPRRTQAKPQPKPPLKSDKPKPEPQPQASAPKEGLFECVNCAVVAKSPRTIQSKYPNPNFGVAKGDPIFQCAGCEQWVPAKQATELPPDYEDLPF